MWQIILIYLSLKCSKKEQTLDLSRQSVMFTVKIYYSSFDKYKRNIQICD